MSDIGLRLAIGFVLMLTSCSIVFVIGDSLLRRVAILVMSCWIAATLLEVVLKRQAEPVIAADFVSGIGLLFLAWRQSRPWLWVMIGLQSALFILHALFYSADTPVSSVEVIGNNVVTTFGLIVMLYAAFGHWRASR